MVQGLDSGEVRGGNNCKFAVRSKQKPQGTARLDASDNWQLTIDNGKDAAPIFIQLRKNKKKMKFVLCDSDTINSYGFRTDVNGIDLSRFKKNPVMLYNHDPLKVIGRWDNISIENAQLTATPVFDTEDPFAAEIARKVEEGFIKGCSMGMVIKSMTKTKGIDIASESVLLEASIVSIPADENALVVYADEKQDKKLSINEFNKLYYQMENTENTQVAQLQDQLAQKDLQIEALKAQVDELSKIQAERDFCDADDAAKKAVAEGKIPAELKADVIAMYLENPDRTARLLSVLNPKAEDTANEQPPAVSLSAMIRKDSGRTEMSWEEYDKIPGALQKLKSENFDEFKRLFKERFGSEYNA